MKNDLKKIAEFVNSTIEQFHGSKLRILHNLNLSVVLSKKNPYLFRANGRAQGRRHRRHRGRPLQGHRWPRHQPADQDHQHRGAADRADPAHGELNRRVRIAAIWRRGC